MSAGNWTTLVNVTKLCNKCKKYNFQSKSVFSKYDNLKVDNANNNHGHLPNRLIIHSQIVSYNKMTS